MDHDKIIASLQAQIDELRQQLTVPTEQRVPAVVHETLSSRRQMLRLAGAAAVGSVAALGAASSAAATDGLTISAGALTSTANPTRVDYTGLAAGSAFVFQSGSVFANEDNTLFPAALSGWATGDAPQPWGVYGYSNDASNGGGVVGYATHIGVMGKTTDPTALAAVMASASGGSTPGVFAESEYGAAVETFSSAGVGARLSGYRGALVLEPVGEGALYQDVVHQISTIEADGAGDIWACVQGGKPGIWRKLAGPQSAGAFHAITPARVYDSRQALPTPGPLAAGNNRRIDIADQRALSGGAVTGPNVVPEGATAISCNITALNTVNSGFLTVNPGDVTTVSAASINWNASGQVFNNGIICALNSNRQVTVLCGGTGSANFAIDVTGYWI